MHRFQRAMQMSRQQLAIQQANATFLLLDRHNVGRFDWKRQLTVERPRPQFQYFDRICLLGMQQCARTRANHPIGKFGHAPDDQLWNQVEKFDWLKWRPAEENVKLLLSSACPRLGYAADFTQLMADLDKISIRFKSTSAVEHVVLHTKRLK